MVFLFLKPSLKHSGSENQIGSSEEKHDESVHTKSDHKQYDCYECDFEVGSKEQLKHHLKNIHGIGQEYRCNECEFNTNEKDQLEVHITLRHKEQQCSKGRRHN